MTAETEIVIDADGHVIEPLDIWKRHLDPKDYDRAPRLVRNEHGQEQVQMADWVTSRQELPFAPASSMVPGGMKDPELRRTRPWSQIHPGGYDPHARIRDMDRDGIDVAVLYPSIGLHLGGIEDPRLGSALFRAYNEWLSEYCGAYPKRLFGIGAMPLLHVDLAIQEAKRAVGTLGLRGVFIRPNPYGGRRLDDPAYDPFWATVQDLDVPVCIHEGTTRSLPTAGLERCKQFFEWHVLSHPHEQQIACMQLICGGVLERFPRLRVVFLESGGGWLPYWLERLDSHYHKLGFIVPEVKRAPSEYFRRQCFISFDPDEKTMPMTVDLVGEDCIVWASDYPHFDAEDPEEIREQPLSASAMRKVLGDNAIRLYGLPLPPR